MFGRPTLVNNVETLYWVPAILEKGARLVRRARARTAPRAVRSYSVSGRVKKPGVVLAPAGSTASELIALCGGMADGHHFKGYLPGGASGGILPAYMADIPLDFGQLEKHGCFVGSHAVVILSDKDDMKDVALNLMRFFEDESCGQCTPCRNGTEKAVQADEAPRLERRPARRPRAGDGRRLDLRPRPGGAEPGQMCVPLFPGGPAMTQDHLRARRQDGRGGAGRDHLAGGAARTAPRSRICAGTPRPATAPTATAAPAWSRSRASACWPPPASARPPPA